MSDTAALDLVRTHLRDSAALKSRTADACAADIARAASSVAAALEGGHKLLLCGNGGSAADCQHMAAEFVSRLSRDRDRRALSALALTTDTSFLTAYANDVGFEGVFARQVEALGRPGDVLIAISTSGESPNVLGAARQARAIGLSVIALMGTDGPLRDLADVAIRVPSDSTQHLQETHLAVEHIICRLVERELFGHA